LEKKIYFYNAGSNEDVHNIIDDISKDENIKKNQIRFLIVTDFKDFLSIDTKNKTTLDLNISEISKNAAFFLPLAGLEKAEDFQESQADIRAAYKMGQLYDNLINDNSQMFKSFHKKNLNFFFTRLLFCFFSDDSSIFKKGIFIKSLISHTKEDGTDLKIYLEKLFKTLNTKDRKNCPEYLRDFPYVNGQLFEDDLEIPNFSKTSRDILIDSGKLDWGNINPDIFGSMMQAVVSNGARQELGMHYTSVKNILKIINPLFLEQLYDEFIQAKDSEKDLKKVLKKIYNIKIFDPSCGSGNFLVICYKELYKLEIEILKKLQLIDKNLWLTDESMISLNQFSGIEIDDFANKAAKLSLWIAQHQMNTIYNNSIGKFRPTLPLSPSANIVNGNSNTIPWENVCKMEDDKKIFIIGNPPYLGSTYQSPEQKKDLDIIFEGKKNYKNLDYISCWFVKAANFICKSKGNIQSAFISTTSICKGEQVSMLWPNILKLKNVEIGFCYQDFKWSNNAKFNAGVICNIISLRNKDKNDKFIFKVNIKIKVKNISPYLIEGSNVIINKEKKPLSELPLMNYGNKLVDGGNLILSNEEKDNLLKENPENKRFIKKLMGAEEYINGKKRYCLWIKKDDLDKAYESEIIRKRTKKVEAFRLNSKDKGANKLSSTPYRFRDIRETEKSSIIIPRLQSERRNYIIVGFLTKDTIVADSSHVIYEPPTYVFSILSCRHQTLWTILSGGTHGSTLRYSISLCYNTFPLKKLSVSEKEDLEKIALKIIDVREKYTHKTLAEIYDPNDMPKDLFSIHKELDNLVDKIFGIKQNSSDKDKTEFLIKEYEKYISNNILI